jgi:catechol 2,3-dioxygenase
MTRDSERPAGSAPGTDQEGGTSPNVPVSLLDTAPYRVGSVALVVRDLDGLARFYRDTLGLATISRKSDTLRLGVGATVLLELRHDAAAQPWSPQRAGLFHTAFLLPSRGHLGAWLAYAAERKIQLSGAADHLVSEAVYLTDPEGNGIEVYVDRPSSEWPRAEDGSIIMRNDRLDHAGLLRAAPAPWRGMPAGGRVGHVHLQVGALDTAERFYADLLGFDVMCRYPGATFLGAGGYHHQLATNIWNSRGAPGRPAGMAGLAEVELQIDTGTLAKVRGRCLEGGSAMTDDDGATVLHDPWGTRLRLVPSSV